MNGFTSQFPSRHGFERSASSSSSIASFAHAIQPSASAVSPHWPSPPCHARAPTAEPPRAFVFDPPRGSPEAATVPSCIDEGDEACDAGGDASRPFRVRPRRYRSASASSSSSAGDSSDASTVAASFGGTPASHRRRKARRGDSYSMRSLGRAIREVDSFDVEATERLFALHAAHPGAHEIDGEELSRVASRLGWPAACQPSFFYLLFAIYNATPAGHRSCSKIGRDGWVTAFRDCDTSTMDGVVRRTRALLDAAYASGSYLFVDFHRFVFTFLLTSARGYTERSFARTVQCGVAKAALMATLGHRSPFAMTFVAFLEATGVRSLNMDHWTTFHSFSRVVEFPTLIGYNFDDCWPCLLDDFVEWVRKVNAFKYHAPQDGMRLPAHPPLGQPRAASLQWWDAGPARQQQQHQQHHEGEPERRQQAQQSFFRALDMPMPRYGLPHLAFASAPLAGQHHLGATHVDQGASDLGMIEACSFLETG